MLDTKAFELQKNIFLEESIFINKFMTTHQTFEQIEKREQLYVNFFHKVYNELHSFEKCNIEILKSISNHIKDTLIIHGQINANFTQ